MGDMFKDSPSPPPAPDYTGAAAQQGQSNVQAAIVSALLGRPNQYSPLGSQTWTQTGTQKVPGVGNTPGFTLPTYSGSINLTPQGQRIYDTQLQQSEQMANLGNAALDRTQQGLSKPFDYSGVQDVQDASYGAQTARLDPQWNQAQTSQETRLVNQGLRPGGEGYDNAMRVFNQGKNDAYQQARLAAIQTAPQTLQQAAYLRTLPLNELNALRSSSQVQMPQFAQQTQGGQVGAAPVYNAAVQQGQYGQGLYNAQMAGQNAITSGLFSLAGAALPFIL